MASVGLKRLLLGGQRCAGGVGAPGAEALAAAIRVRAVQLFDRERCLVLIV